MDKLHLMKNNKTTTKKYQFFISSTLKDLQEERYAVLDSVLSTGNIPAGMEWFSGAAEPQWSIIEKEINQSDAYILIVGNRYGSIDETTEEKISFTEREYNYAVQRRLTIFVFIIDDNALQSKDKYEQDPTSKTKLENFKKKLQNNYVAYWKTPDELANRVSIAIAKNSNSITSFGYVRTEYDVDSLIAKCEEYKKEIEILKNNQLTKERAPKLTLNISPDVIDPDETDLDKGDFSKNDYFANSCLVKEIKSNSIKIKFQNIDVPYPNNEIKKFTEQEIPTDLKEFSSKEDIDNYNSNLPNQAEIKQYNEEYLKYNKAKKCGIPLCFTIDNVGTSPATDIKCKFYLPVEIQAFDMRDILKLKKPFSLNLPESPLEIARNKQFFKLCPNARSSYEINKKFATYFSPNIIGNNSRIFTDLNVDLLSPSLYSNRPKTYIKEIEKDNIYLFQKELQHKDSTSFEGIYLIPSKVGKYTIDVEIMCDEYQDKQYLKIDLIVEE